MNTTSVSIPQVSPLRTRLIYAVGATIATLSVFFTLATTIYDTDPRAILEDAGVTLLFAHLAMLLGPKAYAQPRQRNRFLVTFSLCIGYLCAAAGLYLMISRRFAGWE
jgi:hypothetical protein